MSKEVIIIGAGGHARVISDIIKKSGDVVVGHLDDNVTSEKVIGKIDDCLKYIDKYFVIAIGNNGIRRKIAEKYNNLKYYTAIHPSAIIAEDVVLKEGTVVMAAAVINSSAKVGCHSIINTSAVIEHDNVIGDYCHISPNCALGGTVCVGNNTHIGIGAIVRNNITICEDCVIGAGAVVVSNIEFSDTYVGVPAKKIKKK